MTEPIEKWKEEWNSFVSKFNTESDEWLDMGLDMVFRAGYEAAKRSQPVVDIPAPGKTDHASAAFYACKIFQALTDAGIQYRIKGE